MTRRTRDEIQQALADNDGCINAAARAIGACPKTVRKWARTLERDELPTGEESLTDLVERRKRQFCEHDAGLKARELIEIRVNETKPIGILHFGDPHVDDDGTDLAALERHAAIVRDTPGMYGANIGDVTNNWIGRLQRLYSEQSTTAREAWRLAEWFLGLVDWLYIIGGNHDAWSGAGDPLQWILRGCNGPFQYDGVRIALRFPNGREVRVNARHDFKGHSMWNPAHGVSKAAQMGWRDHILICGHKHVSGYNINVHPDPTSGLDMGIISHCIRVASYKVHDRYARQMGLPNQAISPCAVTIIDPNTTTEPGLVHVFWSPEMAAEYLTWLRNR